MNNQQAIEFVKQLLEEDHSGYCSEVDTRFHFMRTCDCGKEDRDAKFRELLQFLESACCFPNMDVYYEYWEEE